MGLFFGRKICSCIEPSFPGIVPKKSGLRRGLSYEFETQGFFLIKNKKVDVPKTEEK